MPVDEFDGSSRADVSDEERQADGAAQEFLIPQATLNSFILRKSPYISERDVLALAARMEIHPAIVVGQIQHVTGKWNWLTKHIKKVRSHLLDWKYTDGWGKKPLPTGL